MLRKIGKTICLSGDGNTIGREVRKDFQGQSLLEEAMLQIVQGMESEEKGDIRADEGTDESLWPKLLELQKLADDYCVMEGLQSVLDALDKGYYESFYKPSRALASEGGHESEEKAESNSMWRVHINLYTAILSRMEISTMRDNNFFINRFLRHHN